LLRTAIRPAAPDGYPLGSPDAPSAIHGRVAPLLPGQPLLPRCGAGEGDVTGAATGSMDGVGEGMVMSKVGTCQADIQEMYEAALMKNVSTGLPY
jgi:hypothetical protein